MVVDHNAIDNKLYHAVHYVLFQEQVSVRGDWDKLLQKLPYIWHREFWEIFVFPMKFGHHNQLHKWKLVRGRATDCSDVSLCLKNKGFSYKSPCHGEQSFAAICFSKVLQ